MLGLLVRYAAPILISLALGSGGLGAWWFDWTDYKSAILITVAAGLVIYFLTSKSELGKIAAAAVICVACYFKGRIDESWQTQAAIDNAVAVTHDEYKEAKDQEQARIAAINREAEQKAAIDRLTWAAERAKLRSELKLLQEEAERDKNASRSSLSIDAIDRINSTGLRHKRAGARVPSTSRETEAGESPSLDAPALLPPVRTPSEGNDPTRD